MAKLMPAADAKQFKIYLETQIFHRKLDYFRQFRGGNSSYCFHIRLGKNKYVAKILLEKYISDELHNFLSKQSEKLPILRGIKMDKVFPYGKYMATIQKNYGTVLPRRKFSLNLLSEIFNQYNNITQICTPYIPEYAPYSTVSYQTLYDKVSAKRDIKSRFILHFLKKIPVSSLIYNHRQLQIIHGDFNNNQILLQNGQLSAFIDWDSLRIGYPTEDYWEFVYFNLRRLYNPFKLKYWCCRLLQTINTANPSPYNEWQYAINFNLFTQLERLQAKFKAKYLWKFLYLYIISTVAMKHLRNYQEVKAAMRN